MLPRASEEFLAGGLQTFQGYRYGFNNKKKQDAETLNTYTNKNQEKPLHMLMLRKVL